MVNPKINEPTTHAFRTMSSNDDITNNPYLAMREAKIARNQKRLKELGLLTPPQQAIAITQTTARTNKQRQKHVYNHGPVRRSSRISTQTKPDYKDVSLLSSEKDYKQNATIRKRPHSAVTVDDDAAPASKRVLPSKATPVVQPAANSVRSIDLDVHKLVIGNGKNGGTLGYLGEHFGKEFVINQSFSLAASVEDQQRLYNTKLSFNKYCGVQEWKNCIFLWINLGTTDSPNDFLDNNTKITWFGGSKMHDNSPVIHKLLKYGRDAATTKEDSKIILWCRRYQVDVKRFTPYMCCGRLGYHSHMPGSHPLSFVWNLLDCEGLKHHDDLAVRERFELFTR